MKNIARKDTRRTPVRTDVHQGGQSRKNFLRLLHLTFASLRETKKILFVFLLSLTCLAAFSQNNFDPETLLKQAPAPKRLVNDFSNTLTGPQIQALENKLVAFDDSTSTQIAVIIIPSLNGNDVSDFNLKLGRAWGIGGKEFNNGVVLLIAKDEHKLNIATGYGVEGALPDVTAKHIIDDVIVPKFKGDDYYRGIDEGTDAIMRAVKGEYTAPANYRKKGTSLGRIIFYIFMIIIFLGIFGGGSKGGGSFMSRRGFAAWTIGSMLGGGGSGGGWSGGGGSSGGFGGFGGGSFGGGGASGSW